MGGKFHLKLNIGLRPIANKYPEGKVKRTLERELKVSEIAEREANGTSLSLQDCCVFWCLVGSSAQAEGWRASHERVVSLAVRVNVGALVKKTPETCQLASG